MPVKDINSFSTTRLLNYRKNHTYAENWSTVRLPRSSAVDRVRYTAFTQQKSHTNPFSSTQQSNHTLCLLYALYPTAMSSCEWDSSSAVCCGADAEWREVEEGEDTLFSLSFSSPGAFTCSASQLSVTSQASSQREPIMYGALIKSASRQGENTYGAPSHSQLQLKCRSAEEKGT